VHFAFRNLPYGADRRPVSRQSMFTICVSA
jgi:hypothetical protein